MKWLHESLKRFRNPIGFTPSDRLPGNLSSSISTRSGYACRKCVSFSTSRNLHHRRLPDETSGEDARRRNGLKPPDAPANLYRRPRWNGQTKVVPTGLAETMKSRSEKESFW